jgi:uncharacterized damage-inducible protein DinB
VLNHIICLGKNPMTALTTRPAQSEFAPYYTSYIEKVPHDNILSILQQQKESMVPFLSALTEEQASYRYAPGKWSIKELVGHLLDAERIFVCRALRFARNDSTALPGFEEDDYVLHGDFDYRTIQSLVQEYDHVRLATLDFFTSLREEAWSRWGTANGVQFSVRALAWIIAGHELHHRGVIEERYLRVV